MVFGMFVCAHVPLYRPEPMPSYLRLRVVQEQLECCGLLTNHCEDLRTELTAEGGVCAEG